MDVDRKSGNFGFSCWGKVKTVVFIGSGFALLLIMSGLAISGEIQREPLDRLWEEHMLSGTSAVYSNGEPIKHTTDLANESNTGMPFSAAFTKRGIKIGDFRERHFLLLWVGGGWGLDGGLLGKIEERTSTIELYGKQVTRREPSFILNLQAIHNPEEEYSFEFFLLRRKNGASRATVIKKWVIGHGQLERSPGGTVGDARGFLQYDPATKIATVTLKGLERLFVEERIDLSKMLSE